MVLPKSMACATVAGLPGAVGVMLWLATLTRLGFVANVVPKLEVYGARYPEHLQKMVGR